MHRDILTRTIVICAMIIGMVILFRAARQERIRDSRLKNRVCVLELGKRHTLTDSINYLMIDDHCWRFFKQQTKKRQIVGE